MKIDDLEYLSSVDYFYLLLNLCLYNSINLYDDFLFNFRIRGLIILGL